MAAARPVLRRTCLAVGCEQVISPRRVFCPSHWWAVPQVLRVRLHNAMDSWRGQEGASPEWRRALAAAVVAVAEREGRDVPELFRRMAETGLALVSGQAEG